MESVYKINPACLSHMSEQLRHIEGVDLYAYLLESVEQYPYQLSEDFDLGVITSNHGDYLADKSVVLVPKSYEKYFSLQAVELLRNFSGTLMDCYYEMDEGALLYLEAEFKRLLEAKSI